MFFQNLIFISVSLFLDTVEKYELRRFCNGTFKLLNQQKPYNHPTKTIGNVDLIFSTLNDSPQHKMWCAGTDANCSNEVYKSTSLLFCDICLCSNIFNCAYMMVSPSKRKPDKSRNSFLFVRVLHYALKKICMCS